MPRGRQVCALRKDQIEKLQELRTDQCLSYLGLKRVMKAPFTAETLKKAMEGEPVWDVVHKFIVGWVERRLGVPSQPQAARDTKSRSAGDDEPNGQIDAQKGQKRGIAGADGTTTHRGSR